MGCVGVIKKRKATIGTDLINATWIASGDIEISRGIAGRDRPDIFFVRVEYDGSFLVLGYSENCTVRRSADIGRVDINSCYRMYIQLA